MKLNLNSNEIDITKEIKTLLSIPYEKFKEDDFNLISCYFHTLFKNLKAQLGDRYISIKSKVGYNQVFFIAESVDYGNDIYNPEGPTEEFINELKQVLPKFYKVLKGI